MVSLRQAAVTILLAPYVEWNVIGLVQTTVVYQLLLKQFKFLMYVCMQMLIELMRKTANIIIA